ncbi:MAG TPA: hypothetical protein VE978_06200, partial [Chitinophagales bacterium]|nr:hypothetical protein [Chitinophagales bacterium]
MKKICILLTTILTMTQLSKHRLFAAETPNVIRSENSPVTFLENHGQWPDNILYQSTATPINVYFMKDGLSFAKSGEEVVNGEEEEEYSYLVWNMKFLNTSAEMLISGEDGAESKITYLYGNDPGKWVIHPTEYSLLHYNQMYNHIDLDFYGNENNLKYDYLIHQGGDIHSIMAAFVGIDGLSINDAGDLEITTEYGVQLQKAPFAYQVIN